MMRTSRAEPSAKVLARPVPARSFADADARRRMTVQGHSRRMSFYARRRQNVTASPYRSRCAVAIL
jgi:hypothetical protein